MPALLFPLLKLGLLAGGAIGGWIHNNRQRKKALADQERLMALQLKNQQTLNQEQYEKQRLLNEQGQQIQMDTLRATGPAGQMAMLRDAGLNPALLYGKGGMGGMTTGTQGGGSASGSSAASGNAPAVNFMDIIAASQVQADIKLKEAQARKLNVDADKTEGWEKANIEAETENLKIIYDKIGAEIGTEEARKLSIEADTNLKNLELAIKNATKDNVIATAEEQLKQLKQTNDLLGIEIMSSKMDYDNKAKLLEQLIEQNNLNIAMTRIETEAKQQGIELMKEQKKKIRAEIAQGWKALDLQGEQIEVSRDGQKITMRGQNLDYKQGIFGIKMNAYNQKQMNTTAKKIAHINGIYGLGKEVTGALADAYTAPMKTKGRR